MDEALPLELTGVRRSHGDRLALAGVDLAVRPGEVHGLLGPNGAGKTTLLRIVLGLLRPDAGSVLLGGRSHAQGIAALDRVAGFVDVLRFWSYLSGRENLRMLARLDGQGAEARIDPALVRVELSGPGSGERAEDKVAHYSTGMVQRLGVAAALLRDPRLLVLDEPANGLDPAGVRATAVLLRELADAGCAVLLSSHLLADVQRLCDRVTVLDAGRVLFTGRVAELRARAATPQHRLHTSDDVLADAMSPPGTSAGDEGLVLRCGAAELDAYVLALAARGIAVRQLVTVLPSLEDVFLELTSGAAA